MALAGPRLEWNNRPDRRPVWVGLQIGLRRSAGGAKWIERMTAVPPDVVADLSKLVAELEQRLESSFAAHDAAIAQQAATAQENARLQNELAIARDRQNASAEILQSIANTSG